MRDTHRLAAVLFAIAVLGVACAQRDDSRHTVRNPAAQNSPDLQTVALATPSRVEMLLIPGGSFQMGSSNGNPDESPPHPVSVSAFAIDKFEVTQRRFADLELPDPSQFKDEEGTRPVDQIRWSDAAKYCNERSRSEGLQPCYDEDDLDFKCDFEASGYRLPTEAEWEYAARCGSKTPYDFGASTRKLKSYACYAGNSRKRTEPVGRKKPNRWGLFDMYGNVSEWCHDRYSNSYYQLAQSEDPRGPDQGKKRVLRGGSWNSDAAACRATMRLADVPGYADACFARNTYGFRCVRRLSSAEFKLLQDANPGWQHQTP